jgi:hypothetical protein
MLKFHFSEPVNQGIVPFGAVLLVEADFALLQSRALLLSTLNIPVHKATGYSDVTSIWDGASFSVVIINLAPSHVQAAKIAAHVRHKWPSAKILLLGNLTWEFDDPLYDVVDPSYSPSAFVDGTKRLLGMATPNRAGWHES